MAKMMNIKARKKRGSMEGFVYLYHSFFHYGDGMSKSQCEDICYDLYVAYLDTMRWDFPGSRFEELRKKEFVSIIRQPKRPYHTAIQFYKALDYLLAHVHDACLQAKQWAASQEARRFLLDRETFFKTVTGIPIRSQKTVYPACAYSLLPASNEPRHTFAMGHEPWRDIV